MKFPFVSGVLTCVCFAFGCGSAVTSENKTEVVNANPANNAGIVPYAPTNAAALNTNSPNAAVSNQSVTVVNPPSNPKPMTFSAPDDSEYSTIMDKSGGAVETRSFRNNKYITKVTRVWKGVNDKTISIYLKNGKVVNLPGDKWADIKSQPVEVFYDAAGIKPAAPPANANAPMKTKPAEKQ